VTGTTISPEATIKLDYLILKASQGHEGRGRRLGRSHIRNDADWVMQCSCPCEVRYVPKNNFITSRIDCISRFRRPNPLWPVYAGKSQILTLERTSLVVFPSRQTSDDRTNISTTT